ncbi:MAG: hypothetical protein KKD69_06935 [Euryarchaeota archaeon]|nr:hypothetical protein [Euryarchaeota archaeon]MCG2727736.1 hypothetical protein [Candidatus Methanoperedenaceae archaeon]
MTSITAKNAENAKITVTTNSKRTHNELRVRTSSYQFAVKMKLCEHSAWYGKILKPQYRTRMTRIGRIFTDIFNPCKSVLSVRSVFYRVCCMCECRSGLKYDY